MTVSMQTESSTNPQSATSVSPLEPSGSSKNDISGALPVKPTKKNEFLMSFKAGKVAQERQKNDPKIARSCRFVDIENPINGPG